MRFPRMTTRRWMVLVAALGGLLGVVPELLCRTPTGQRRLREAADHARRARGYRFDARQYQAVEDERRQLLASLKRREELGLCHPDPSLIEGLEESIAAWRGFAAGANRDAAHHEAMAARYEAAARWIWEPEPGPN